MTIAQTRRWLVEMAPDQVLGRAWSRNGGEVLRVLAIDPGAVQTTSGRMTWGGLAHRLARGYRDA